MRWIKKSEADLGEERVVYRFLFLPRRFRNEYRWLEHSWIKQTYQEYFGFIFDMSGWVNVAWGDVYEYLK